MEEVELGWLINPENRPGVLGVDPVWCRFCCWEVFFLHPPVFLRSGNGKHKSLDFSVCFWKSGHSVGLHVLDIDPSLF